MCSQRFRFREALGGVARGAATRDRETILRIVEPAADDVEAVLEHDHGERRQVTPRRASLSRAVRVSDDAALEYAGLKRIEHVALVAVRLGTAVGDVCETIAIGGELGAFSRRGALLELREQR